MSGGVRCRSTLRTERSSESRSEQIGVSVDGKILHARCYLSKPMKTAGKKNSPKHDE